MKSLKQSFIRRDLFQIQSARVHLVTWLLIIIKAKMKTSQLFVSKANNYTMVPEHANLTGLL